MFKKLAAPLAIAVALFAAVGYVKSASVSAAVEYPYEYFCHRTNAVDNPYTQKPFSGEPSEINGKGENDHSHHTGPVVSTAAQAQLLKDAKIDWGDIIPPVPGVLPVGINWTSAGQAVYYAGCEYPKKSPYETPANLNFSVICSEDKKNILVNMVNIGDEMGTIYINDIDYELEGHTSKTESFAVGKRIVIRIGQDVKYDQTPVCETETPEEPEVPVVGGRGGGSTTTTPQPSAEVLPFTAGVNYMAVISLVTAGSVALSLASKKLYARFF